MSISLERLKQILRYDPISGNFFRLRLDHINVYGKMAGSCQSPGKYGSKRVIIRIENKDYFAHRLAWFYMTGKWPIEDIDHIDGDSLNNKWNNLRLATPKQNSANAKISRANTSGAKGVSWDKRRSRWHARIFMDGRHKHLGYFVKLNDAAKAYENAALEYWGDFSRAEKSYAVVSA